MFKFNNTSIKCNQDNGQNQSGGGGALFATGSSPFEQSGNNIFEAMKKPGNNAADTTTNMQAPSMGNNGMPNNANSMPQQNNQQSNIVPNTTIPNTTIPNNNNTANNNNNNNNNSNTNTNQQGGSPLDIYSQNRDNSNNQPQHQNQQQAPQQQAPQQQQSQAPTKTIFDTDLKGWEGAMKNVDLAAGVTPEQIQAATGGDANALMDIIQQVSRTAMQNAAHMSTKVAGNGFSTGMETFGKTIPGMITNHQYSNMWEGDSVMNHETAQPMVQAMTNSLRQQFPQATPQELQTKVREYFDTFSQTLTGQQQQQENKQPEVTTSDISNFFNS